MKKLLIIAAVLIIIGAVIFVSVMITYDWDFGKLGTKNYITNTHTLDSKPVTININVDTADIQFIPSNEIKVECFEQTNYKHTVLLEGDILNINLVDERKWYEYININFNSPSIVIYLPSGEYGSLVINSTTGHTVIPSDFRFKDANITKSTGDVSFSASTDGLIEIKTSTGKILVNDLTAGSLRLETSTGKIIATALQITNQITSNVSTGNTELNSIQCGSLISNGSTGNVSLTNVIATDIFKIERSTGHINFNECDASEIFATTDTGDIKGSILSEKIFFATTDTGQIDIPKTMTGGKCEITTDTGDIKITIG